MKGLDFRKKILQNTLQRLTTDFGVPSPILQFKKMKRLHGFYTFFMITINLKTLEENLAEANRTLRHEFYHYLEYALSLPNKKSELKARRFEKKYLRETLPKTQKKLSEK